MEVVITDITDMSPGTHCVAGVDMETNEMVRLLPGGHNWSTALLVGHEIASGSIIAVEPTGQPHNGQFPHIHEDTRIWENSIQSNGRAFDNWLAHPVGPVFQSLQEAFEGHVNTRGVWNNFKKGVHVLEGVQTRSLSGLRILRGSIRFFEDLYDPNKPKLRVELTDASDSYQLPVSGTDLHRIWHESGVGVLNNMLPGGELHLRTGLARPWNGQPNKCTVMLNGVLW